MRMGSKERVLLGALLALGSQRARTTMAEKPVVRIMMLKRPKRSARMPGNMRPKMEEAFRMGIR